MSVTIDIKLLGFVLVIIAVLILIAYLIQMIRKLTVTLERTNKILKDTEVVSGIVSKRSKDVDAIVGDVAASTAAFASAWKEKQGVVAATTAVVKAMVSVKNAIKKEKEN